MDDLETLGTGDPRRELREGRSESNYLGGNEGNIPYLPNMLVAPLLSISRRSFGPYATQSFIRRAASISS